MLKSDITLAKHNTRKRVLKISLAFILAALLLLFNVFRLDYLLYDYYKQKAFDQITTTSTLKAERGNIYDANMNLLATTETSWRIFVSTREIKTRSQKEGIDYAQIIAEGVSKISSSDKTTIYNKIKNTNQLDVTLLKSADENQYNKVIEISF